MAASSSSLLSWRLAYKLQNNFKFPLSLSLFVFTGMSYNPIERWKLVPLSPPISHVGKQFFRRCGCRNELLAPLLNFNLPPSPINLSHIFYLQDAKNSYFDLLAIDVSVTFSQATPASIFSSWA
ncbi:hypothetical protein ACH5RR_037775 [Cinchona calisaya]|uniref:Uncharacterized protein n=1 Tax=Cinchona calisaya TaxID=153742 RepID=A0ABD2Y8I5_9GENT